MVRWFLDVAALPISVFGTQTHHLAGPHFPAWGTLLAPWNHLGRAWEQQDGHEVARHRIFVDFGVISGRVYVSFWSSKCVKSRFIFKLVSRSLVYRFLT